MLLAGSPQGIGGLQRVVIAGLPEFNAGDPAFVVTRFEGWYSSVVATPHLVLNGGGPGVVAIDEEPAEVYYSLSGSIDCGSWEALEGIRAALLQGLVVGENAVKVLDDRAGGKHRQVFVRAYEKPDVEALNAILTFTFPLVAPDPYKYGLTEITAFAGGFQPEDWFRTYTEDAATGDWYRTYAADGAEAYRTYTEAEADTSSLPRTAVLTSDGDATSQRLTMAVQGPVTLGEWFIERVDDGSRIWVDTSLAVGQELVLDSSTRTARLDGSDVDHLVYGDFQTLRPGSNAWRLVVGSSGAGSSMSVTGLPAHL